MALIAPQPVPVNGRTVTFAAAAASDTFVPVEGGQIHYRTSGTGSTVTVVVPGNDEHGQAKADVALVLGATAHGVIKTGPYRDDRADGVITITSTSQTGLTVAYVV